MRLYNTIRSASLAEVNSDPMPPALAPTVLTPENQEYINQLRQLGRSRGSPEGAGIMNSIIKKMPFEMHMKLSRDIPSEHVENGSFNNTGKYSYCGPGTKLDQRIKEGYEGVNSLDKACKQHDIAYSQIKNVKDRNAADDILAKQASEITLDVNEPAYVKNDARFVTGIMAGKAYLGMGTADLKKSTGANVSVCVL